MTTRKATNQTVISKKGTNYYSYYNDAMQIRDELTLIYPGARIVGYELGWAVQYYKAGSYYPTSPA